jgi:Ankyrin repeats (3 copies)
VIDPVTGDIYGIIIATAPEAKESYMIPAYQVYGSIKSRLPRGAAAEFAETQKETQALSQDAADIVSEASASLGGYEKIVELLLNRGADVNAQGGHYGNALQAASYGGHEKIVELLLKRGADVNTQGGEYGNALQAASYGGHEKIVELLLNRGADVNAQGGYYGNALQAASSRGHEKIVEPLLNRGEVRPSERIEDSMGDAQKPLWDLLSRIFNNDHVAASALKQLLRDGRGEVHPSEKMEDSSGYDEIRYRGRPIQPLVSGNQTSYQPVHSAPSTSMKRSFQESEGPYPALQLPNLQPRPSFSSASPVVQPANVDLTAPRPSPLGAIGKPKGKPGRPSREEIARRQAEAATEGSVYVPQLRKRNKPKKPKTLTASPVPPFAGASTSTVSSSSLQTPTPQIVEPQQSSLSGRRKRPRIEE